MKKLLLLMALVTCTATSTLAEEINAVVLHMSNGKTVTCLLDDQPVITFKDNDFVINTHMNSFSYQSEDVLKFTYAYVDQSGLKDISMAKTMFSLDKNKLIVRNLEPLTILSAYYPNGAVAASATTDSKGNATLVLPDAFGTTFIIKTSSVDFKITLP